jgi:hypothetical protein
VAFRISSLYSVADGTADHDTCITGLKFGPVTLSVSGKPDTTGINATLMVCVALQAPQPPALRFHPVCAGAGRARARTAVHRDPTGAAVAAFLQYVASHRCRRVQPTVTLPVLLVAGTLKLGTGAGGITPSPVLHQMALSA